MKPRLAVSFETSHYWFLTEWGVIIWLNWSTVKRRILIGSLSGPNFAVRRSKMDRSRTDFTDLSS